MKKWISLLTILAVLIITAPETVYATENGEMDTEIEDSDVLEPDDENGMEAEAEIEEVENVVDGEAVTDGETDIDGKDAVQEIAESSENFIIELPEEIEEVAEETVDTEYQIIEPVTETYINPIYADEIDESDLRRPSEAGIEAVLDDVQYYTTIEDVAAEFRKQFKERIETIKIGYQTSGSYDDILKEISGEALKHTGIPDEGDYMKWQYAGWQGNSGGYVSDGVNYLTLTYTVTYYTTASQEEQVNEKISEVLNTLNVNEKSDYDKVCAVYDYICDNVTYDYVNLNDDTYKLKHTAYAALINGTSVCQGYAVLFYRLALELNVDARLISGTGNGGAHGWNIVCLGRKYYNLDATWDSGRSPYSYFLKCEANFANHIRNNDYLTEEFCSKYPMSLEDYSEETISVKDVSELLVEDISGQIYTGASLEPEVVIKDGNIVLEEGADYTITYNNNINAGTASVVITGHGTYTGIRTITFAISARSISTATIDMIADQTYTGQAFTPTVTVKDGKKVLVSGKDYVVTYSNNVNVGTAKVTVSGTGNYSGVLTKTFAIKAKPVVRGWKEINGNWYYYDASGVMQTGWANVGGIWYYLNSNGTMQTGWINVGGTWYYLNNSGAMQTGWINVGGTWYYLNSSGAMQMDWINIGGVWYYLNSSGAMQTGWINVGGAWYYLNSSGAMQTGWINVGGTWYYLNGSGAMVSSNTVIDGRMNRFNSSGAWLGIM